MIHEGDEEKIRKKKRESKLCDEKYTAHIWERSKALCWPKREKSKGKRSKLSNGGDEREENIGKERGEREKGKEMKEKNTKGIVEWWKRKREGNTVSFLLRWGTPHICLRGCYARHLHQVFFYKYTTKEGKKL